MNIEKQAKQNAIIGLSAMAIITIISLSIMLVVFNKGKQEELKEQIDRHKIQLSEIEKKQELVEKEIDKLSEEKSVKRLSTLEVVEEASSISLDPNFEALVKATWRIETGNGTSYLWKRYNNAGGIKDYYTGNYVSYQSEEEGMQALRELLLNKYVDKYDYDLKSIRKEYCYQCGHKDYKVFKELFEEELVK